MAFSRRANDKLGCSLVVVLVSAGLAAAGTCKPKYEFLGGASASATAQETCHAIDDEAQCNAKQLPDNLCWKDSNCMCYWTDEETIQSATGMPIYQVGLIIFGGGIVLLYAL